MSVWGVIGKLIAGKPVFEDSAQGRVDDWGDDKPTDAYADEKGDAETPASLYNSAGVKQIPTVGADKVQYHVSGTDCEIWAAIRNHSARAIELDKIVILGQKTELDYRLQPHEEREFRIFRGPHPTTESHKKAELYYKDILSGDYFRADHLIHYHYEHDKSYSVTALQLITPIYDV